MNDAPILQVEDDENDVLLLRYVFRTAGITSPVCSVASGQEAMDYLAGTGEFADRGRFPFPGLVLLDIKLPRVGGLEVLQWIRAHPQLRTLVVIMFTASASQREIDDAYALGANSFVIKPAGTKELTELIRALNAYWTGYNRFASPGGGPASE
jgi:CheY-like chemotaxis protein